MKRFIQMLLLMLFFAAFTVAAPPGTTKQKCEHQYSFIQAQPDLMILATTTPLYQPEKGFSISYRQGDVEKSLSIASNLVSGCSQSELSPDLKIMKSGYMRLSGNLLGPSENCFRGRYRLDIGETKYKKASGIQNIAL